MIFWTLIMLLVIWEVAGLTLERVPTITDTVRSLPVWSRILTVLVGALVFLDHFTVEVVF